MSTIGAQLKAAREAKGLTASELAASIKALTTIIEKIEVNDFSRLPAPIYVRGFIKLYARCVGLNPIPLLEEYTAIQASPTGKPDNLMPGARNIEHARQAATPERLAPTTPKKPDQSISSLPGHALPKIERRPPEPAQPAARRHFPKIHLPRLRLPDIRISAEAWRGISMVAGVGAIAFLIALGVREIAARRSMAVSRDMRLIQEPPAPYLSLPNPATPPARR